jgi:hypothetical protein
MKILVLDRLLTFLPFTTPIATPSTRTLYMLNHHHHHHHHHHYYHAAPATIHAPQDCTNTGDVNERVR